MSEAYDLHTRRHRRLSILRILSEAPGYKANDSLLGTVVNEFGIVSTRDQVRGDLLWLKEQGYLTIAEVGSAMIAMLTETGGEIAAGHSANPGIARLSPRA